METIINNVRPDPDPLLIEIANYVQQLEISSTEAYTTARLCVMDAMGCAMAALAYPACSRLLGPVVPGTIVPDGARVRERTTPSIRSRRLLI